MWRKWLELGGVDLWEWDDEDQEKRMMVGEVTNDGGHIHVQLNGS